MNLLTQVHETLKSIKEKSCMVKLAKIEWINYNKGFNNVTMQNQNFLYPKEKVFLD